MEREASLATLALAASTQSPMSLSSSLRCLQCETRCADGDALFRHWLLAHCRLESDSIPAKRRRRDACARRSKRRSRNMRCGSCHDDVRSVTAFFLHWLDVHAAREGHVAIEEVWQCSQCQPTTLLHSRARLLKHIRDKHRVGKENEDCNKCEESEESQSLRSHLAEAHRCYRLWTRLEAVPHSDVKRNVEVGADSLSSQENTSEDETMYEVQTKPSLNGTVLKCRGCHLIFTSTKLLEKHYQANHAFQCKFCHVKMDKDVYGDHLKIHLAEMRKKTSQGKEEGLST